MEQTRCKRIITQRNLKQSYFTLLNGVTREETNGTKQSAY